MTVLVMTHERFGLFSCFLVFIVVAESGVIQDMVNGRPLTGSRVSGFGIWTLENLFLSPWDLLKLDSRTEAEG